MSRAGKPRRGGGLGRHEAEEHVSGGRAAPRRWSRAICGRGARLGRAGRAEEVVSVGMRPRSTSRAGRPRRGGGLGRYAAEEHVSGGQAAPRMWSRAA
ncbi:hypothetical protein C4D60_Mb04t19200 [Musa balbisiana]|uniref:Uncharacterized protein n=1 Tax=Musa balbisiana TaxID=52838 RepID=A0A4S8KD41_MUSBA|nr:hypothetical protein C4D60_Mb04t19200 [Musa balbisiana]